MVYLLDRLWARCYVEWLLGFGGLMGVLSYWQDDLMWFDGLSTCLSSRRIPG